MSENLADSDPYMSLENLTSMADTFELVAMQMSDEDAAIAIGELRQCWTHKEAMNRACQILKKRNKDAFNRVMKLVVADNEKQELANKKQELIHF